MLGEIIWYNAEKEFGFIDAYELTENVFLHQSNLMCNETLMYPKQLVSFTPQKEEKGWVAHEVVIPIGEILHGHLLGINNEGYGVIFTKTFSDKSGHYSFRKRDIKGICEPRNHRNRRAEVLFQPRKHGHKKIAIDVWTVLPQGWGTNVQLEEERGKQLIEAASSGQGYCFSKRVYIFKAKDESNKPVYKIGYSSNPELRLESIQKQYQTQVEFIHEIYSDDAYVVEQALHVIFRNKTYKDIYSWEWFELEQADLEWLETLFYIDCEKLRESVRNEIGMVGCEILFIGCRQ